MLRAVQRTKPEVLCTSKDSGVVKHKRWQVHISCESSEKVEGWKEARTCDYALRVIQTAKQLRVTRNVYFHLLPGLEV